MLPFTMIIIANRRIREKSGGRIAEERSPHNKAHKPLGSAILFTCRKFYFSREYGDLYNFYYENNLFALQNPRQQKFFSHPGSEFVRRAIIHPLFMKPWCEDPYKQMDESDFVTNLYLLKRLRHITLRAAWYWSDNSWWINLPAVIHPMQVFLRTLCQSCEDIEVIQILEPWLQTNPGWEELLRLGLDSQALWPDGLPSGRKPITINVSSHCLSSSCSELPFTKLQIEGVGRAEVLRNSSSSGGMSLTNIFLFSERLI